MKEYFDTNEKQDLQLLYDFNWNKNLFTSIVPEKEKSQYDCTCTRGNRTFAVELKRRLIPVDKYKSIMIEDYKYLELLLEYQFNGKEPLYINFCNDAIIIFNLLRLKHKPKLRILNIKSEGYDTMQLQERRYMLNINDAVIYRLNNNTKGS